MRIPPASYAPRTPCGDCVDFSESPPYNWSVVLTIKVAPGAAKTAIKRFENGILYVSVAAAPEKGEANKELIRFLAEKFSQPRSAIELLTGAGSRLKRVRVAMTEDTLRSCLF